jgi:hypothetical protein
MNSEPNKLNISLYFDDDDMCLELNLDNKSQEHLELAFLMLSTMVDGTMVNVFLQTLDKKLTRKQSKELLKPFARALFEKNNNLEIESDIDSKDNPIKQPWEVLK